MFLSFAFATKPLMLSLYLFVICLLVAYALFRKKFTTQAVFTTQATASDLKVLSATDSTLMASTTLQSPSLSQEPAFTPISSTTDPDTSSATALAQNFWQFTALCVIGKSLTHRQTRKNLLARDPENLSILDKWAARDLFSFVPIRTQTQMMYAEDGNLITERPDGQPCSSQNDIIPMLCFSKQALCALIFHISQKKFYTVDPSHAYHGSELFGYFTDSEGSNIQAEIEQELHDLTENDMIDLATFTHVELSPKTALVYTEYAVYNFLCQAMCLALSYEFDDRTLHPSPQDFGDLLANTFVNTQDSYHSRHVTLSRLQKHDQLFSEPVNAEPNSKKHGSGQNNALDPRSVTFSEINDLCYLTDCTP